MQARQMLEARKRALKAALLAAKQQQLATVVEPVNGELPPQPAVNGELSEPVNGKLPHHHPNGNNKAVPLLMDWPIEGLYFRLNMEVSSFLSFIYPCIFRHLCELHVIAMKN